MKKFVLIATLSTILTACSSGSDYDIRNINAKRNSVEAQVTLASAAQADLQREQELKERINRRQMTILDHQDTMDSMESIGSSIRNTVGEIFKVH